LEAVAHRTSALGQLKEVPEGNDAPTEIDTMDASGITNSVVSPVTSQQPAQVLSICTAMQIWSPCLRSMAAASINTLMDDAGPLAEQAAGNLCANAWLATPSVTAANAVASIAVWRRCR